MGLGWVGERSGAKAVEVAYSYIMHYIYMYMYIYIRTLVDGRNVGLCGC